MQVQKNGSRGRPVALIQVALNTQLRPDLPLSVDGVFGPRTEKAVRRFQKYAGLAVDGVVGHQTLKALLSPAKTADANLKKFRAELGTVDDFVEYVKGREKTLSSQGLFDVLSDFKRTDNGVRYLMVRDEPRVIDFRHFFAAAAETFAASLSKKTILPIGGTRGDTLFLGVANELSQCIDEGLRRKINSCFSPEDLGSNRLGAEFGRSLTIAAAEASRTPVSSKLRTFLTSLSPLAPKAIEATTLPGAASTAKEGVHAIMTTILDAFIPEAY